MKRLQNLGINQTTNVLNQINPDNIRLMSLAVKQDTGLAELIANGSFSMLSEVEMIEEQGKLLEKLEGIDSRFHSNHSVNLLTEIAGVLPKDKTKLLTIIDNFLSLSEAQKLNFILGKRLGYYHRLSDLKNSFAYNSVQKQVEKIQRENPGSFESVFHDLRNRLI